jgi:hypothetical protein
VALVFATYEKSYVNKYSISLGHQIIETLTEFIQGPCAENQKTLINGKVIDNCRDLISSFNTKKEILSKGFEMKEEDLDEIDELKRNAVTLLLSLIEGAADFDVIKRMTNSLDNF